ncbi:MAG: HDOD domain-containing protein [Planctomycetaceae bacterium]|nr:HDOD domain-containing protein [Planctomycetaceae bacterium]
MSDRKVDEIIKAVQAISPLPAEVTRLNELLEDSSTTVDEIAEVISQSPTFSSQTLKITNSSFYGLRGKVTSVSRAVIVLGAAHLRNLAMGFSAFASIENTQSKAADELSLLERHQLWQHSLSTALIARELSLRLRIGDPDLVFTSALLHDFGKLIFMVHFPKEYQQVLEQHQREQVPLHELETACFGIDHAQLGRMICDKWQFPRELADAVSNHHNMAPGQKSFIDLISSADAISLIAGTGFGGSNLISVHCFENLLRSGCPVSLLLELIDTTRRSMVAIDDKFFLPEEAAIISPEDWSDRISIDVRDDAVRVITTLVISVLGLQVLSEGERVVVLDQEPPASNGDQTRYIDISSTKISTRQDDSGWKDSLINLPGLQQMISEVFITPAGVLS